MSAINNTINLTDRMSPVLKSVMKALDSTMKAMDQLDRATNRGMNGAAFKQATADIKAANNAINSLNRSLDTTSSKMGFVAKAFQKLRDIPIGIQSRGNSIMDRAERGIMYNRAQGNIGGVLKNKASMAGGAALVTIGQIPTMLGSGIAAVKNFGSSVNTAMDTMSTKAHMAYTETLSFINLIEKGIGVISGLMSANDQVTSDIAKIGLFNYDPNMSNAQAYGMAYKAAENSRSDLSDTTNLINRIMMSGVYGQEAGSLGSATRMAETLNKAMVIGGGTSEENKRALIQLSQGLSSGVLQGDELRSIREQSPYLAQVLAEGLAQVDDKFIGTTVGDLKELGSQGQLTSDVVIKAFEAMQDQVDATFEDKAPRTWAQGIQSISNTIKVMTGYLQSMEGGPLQKISELVWIIADYLKSTDGVKLMSGIANMLTFIGNILNVIVQAALTGISWLMNNSWALYTILLAIGLVILATVIPALWSMVVAAAPFLLIAGIVILIIWLFMQMGFTFSQIVGGVCGGINVMIAFFTNLVIAIWEGIQNIYTFFYNLFSVDLPQVILEFVLLAIQLLSPLLDTISAVGNLFGKDWDLTANWSNWAVGKQQDLESKRRDYVSGGAFQEGWASDAYNSGYEWGTNALGTLTDGIGDFTDGLAGFMEGNDALYSQATGGGVNVAGGNLDSVGSIKNDVNIADEDIQLLRDMAARDYLLNLQQVTPVAHISFGDVRETADVNKIMDVIEDMVEEQMATSLVSN